MQSTRVALRVILVLAVSEMQPMIGQTISHYKILEKLYEVPNFPKSDSQRVVGSARIPTLLVESCLRGKQ